MIAIIKAVIITALIIAIGLAIMAAAAFIFPLLIVAAIFFVVYMAIKKKTPRE